MSHFTVLVIGDNPEEQLKPFDENLKGEWIDKTEEYKNEYETETVSEFYCGSSSSWGQEITKELFDFISNNKIGTERKFIVEKKTGLSYFKNNQAYCGYHTIEDRRRCEGDAWFKVKSIDKTGHPDPNVCFEGEITIEVIEPPKEIPMKEKYPNYETFLKDYHGVKDISKQGYWTNANAKWDWYELGGRWTGMLKIKQGSIGETGKPGLGAKSAKIGFVDSARKCDVDFEGMAEQGRKESAEAYDLFLKKYEEDKKCEKFHPQFEFGVTGEMNDGVFIPESKESYIQKHSRFVTFSVLRNGEWFERGEMGWWGMARNEKPDEIWDEEFAKLLNELPEDTLLSVYDCHI